MREYGIQSRLGPGFHWDMVEGVTYDSVEEAENSLSYYQDEFRNTSFEYRVVSRPVNCWVVE